MLEIDGSHEEGGGQLLRTAVGLAAFTQQPVRVFNIRAKRPHPGLKNQHVEAVRAVAALCSAETKGVELGSREIVFTPGEIAARDLEVKIGTAGSIGLVLQALMIPAMRAARPVTVRFKGGGTFGKWAPPLLYTKHVLAPMLAKHGYKSEINIQKHGFYPKGGAEAAVKLFPATLEKFEMAEVERPGRVDVVSIASKDLERGDVARRQAKACAEELVAAGLEARYGAESVDALSTGSGLVAFSGAGNAVIGADALGEKGVKAEDIGRQCANAFIEDTKAGGVDRHAGDQLIPYLAITGGRILFATMTGHAKTNIWVAEKLLKTRMTVDNRLVSSKGMV